MIPPLVLSRRRAAVLMAALGLAATSLPPARAAGWAELTGPLVPTGKVLYQLDTSAYVMHEKGIHGSASFAGFRATPHTQTISNRLTFAPTAASEISLGVADDIPAHHIRSTQNNSGVVTARQQYDLLNNDALDISGRLRHGGHEWGLSVLARRQRSDWNYATTVSAVPIYFNHIRSSYEDARLAWGWHSAALRPAVPAGLSTVDRPLMGAGETWLESEVGLRNGRLSHDGDFYVANKQDLHYLFRTMPHAIPRAVWHYGLADGLELTAGAGVRTPFAYKYTYELYKVVGPTSQIINGCYDYKAWVDVPLALRWRPRDTTELAARLDATYVDQNLSYSQKKENGTLTAYEDRKLQYYNFRPALTLSHLDGKDARSETFLKRRILSRGAWLHELGWSADVTVLNKNSAGGTQNFADPYEVYQNPVDFFREGTEYAAFLSGNNASTPAQVAPQNYHEVRVQSGYGLRDGWDVSLGAGYRTQATAHQFSLSDLSERAFKFRPFYYLDGGTQWRWGKSCLLTLDVHYVPSYRTEMFSSVQPEQFKEHTSYVVANAGIRILF